MVQLIRAALGAYHRVPTPKGWATRPATTTTGPVRALATDEVA